MNNNEYKQKYDALLTEYSEAVRKLEYAKVYVDTTLKNNGPYNKEYFKQAEYLKDTKLDDIAAKLLEAEKLYFLTTETQTRIQGEMDEVQKQNHEKIFSYL